MEAVNPYPGKLNKQVAKATPPRREYDRRLLDEEAKDIRHLPIDEIGIHYNTLAIDGQKGYQRTLNTRKIEKMVDEFDPAELTAIVVSERKDGSFWVIDGQHRLEALRILGKRVILADVRHGLDLPGEARLFYRLNAGTTKVETWSEFQARLRFDPTAQAIERVVQSYGYHFDRSGNSMRSVSAVAAVERVYKRGQLEDVLDITSRVWRSDPHATDGPVLEGLAIFLHSYEEQPAFDLDRLLDVLSVISATEVLQRQRRLVIEMGRGGTRPPALVAMALRDVYNGRRSSRKLSGPPVSGTGRAMATIKKNRKGASYKAEAPSPKE